MLLMQRSQSLNPRRSFLEISISIKSIDRRLTISSISAPKLAPASLKYPDITVLAATQWNIMAHAGFIRSFLSAVRYAPGSHEQAAWSRLASQKRKILIFVATHDPIVFPEDLKCDVEELLLGSESKAEWRVVEGAHDMTNTHPEKIAADICGFWGM
jgi:hypothetical protein